MENIQRISSSDIKWRIRPHSSGTLLCWKLQLEVFQAVCYSVGKPSGQYRALKCSLFLWWHRQPQKEWKEGNKSPRPEVLTTQNTETPGQGSSLHGVHRNLSIAPFKEQFLDARTARKMVTFWNRGKEASERPVILRGNEVSRFPEEGRTCAYLLLSQSTAKRETPRKPQAMYGREAPPAWSSSRHREPSAQGSLAAAALSPGPGPRRAAANRGRADSSTAVTARHGLRPTQNARPPRSSRLPGAPAPTGPSAHGRGTGPSRPRRDPSHQHRRAPPDGWRPPPGVAPRPPGTAPAPQRRLHLGLSRWDRASGPCRGSGGRGRGCRPPAPRARSRCTSPPRPGSPPSASPSAASARRSAERRGPKPERSRAGRSEERSGREGGPGLPSLRQAHPAASPRAAGPAAPARLGPAAGPAHRLLPGRRRACAASRPGGGLRRLRHRPEGPRRTQRRRPAGPWVSRRGKVPLHCGTGAPRQTPRALSWDEARVKI